MEGRSLQEFVSEAGGGGHLRVEHDFGDGFVRLRTSEAERRQAAQDIRCSEDIVLELLRNARDAHASHIFLASSRDGANRVMTVVDDGDGIPPSMHEHVFEPRVTSKLDTSHMDAWGLHGRGMALYSIAENATCAYIADSDVARGCSVHVETDTGKLKEKADQSGFPVFEFGDSGTVNVRGPRNILRTCCEFAIESRDSCTVYVGSPAEVAATMHAFGKATLSTIDRVFCQDASQLPVAKRLAAASDPEDLSKIAQGLGLDISTRTARRILDGQISVLDDLLARVEEQLSRSSRGKAGKARKRSGRSRVRIMGEEAGALACSVLEAYGPIADRYYLDSDVEPKVKVTVDSITISIPIVEKE